VKKYLVVGGIIFSRTDGDMHYISPKKLIRLYGVPRNECRVAMDWNDKARLLGLDLSKFIILEPDYQGKYAL